MSDSLRPGRTRRVAVPILVAAPILFFLGLAGVHGGGWALGTCALLGLASVPVGIGVARVGVPRDRRGVAFAVLYLGICVAAFLLAARDLEIL